KFANKKIDLAFEEEVDYLSPKAERHYAKIMHDIESGKEKVYTANNAEDLLKQLHAYSKN
ncbi:MAG: hypothetical protein Q7R43_03370, partial [Candidatus Daviesbacteria bacterium]|nr:hypothetical protein [Candidatus Daviesbacteria bacterium]